VAWHAASRSLHARLAVLPPERQARLLVSASRDVLVVSGVPNDLPWAPGVAYAHCCAEAPTLWRPTLLRPNVPIDLLTRALRRRHTREPLLLWPDPDTLVPLDRLLRVSPELLARIAERWQSA
jgi:hypothetical protein